MFFPKTARYRDNRCFCYCTNINCFLNVQLQFYVCFTLSSASEFQNQSYGIIFLAYFLGKRQEDCNGFVFWILLVALCLCTMFKLLNTCLDQSLYKSWLDYVLLLLLSRCCLTFAHHWLRILQVIRGCIYLAHYFYI